MIDVNKLKAVFKSVETYEQLDSAVNYGMLFLNQLNNYEELNYYYNLTSKLINECFNKLKISEI